MLLHQELHLYPGYRPSVPSHPDLTGKSPDFSVPRLLPDLSWTLPTDRDRLPHFKERWQGGGTLPGSARPLLPDSPPTTLVCWRGDRVWLISPFLREETTVLGYAGSFWEHLPGKVSTLLGLGGHLMGLPRAHGRSQANSAKPAELRKREWRGVGDGHCPVGVRTMEMMLCTVDRCALLMNAAHD